MPIVVPHIHLYHFIIIAEAQNPAVQTVEDKTEKPDTTTTKATKTKKLQQNHIPVEETQKKKKKEVISVPSKPAKTIATEYEATTSVAEAVAAAAKAAASLLAKKKKKKVTEYFPVPDIAEILHAADVAKNTKKPSALVVDVVQPVVAQKKSKSKKQTSENNGAVLEIVQQQQLVSVKSKKAKNTEANVSAVNGDAAAASKSLAATKKKKNKRSVVDAALDDASTNAEQDTDEPQRLPITKKFKSSKSAIDTSKVKKRLNILTSQSSSASDADVTIAVGASSSKQVELKDNYKILQTRSMPTPIDNSSNKQKKRKNAEPQKTQKRKFAELDKPQWTSAGAFVVSQLSTQLGGENYALSGTPNAGTEFAVKSLSKKRKRNAGGADDVADDSVARFRERAMFNKKHVVRETAKELLQRKLKQSANARV